jgi:flagellar hook-associated protein 2
MTDSRAAMSNILSTTPSTAAQLASLTSSLLQSSGGVTSSLNTTEIVAALVQADSVPLQNLQQKQSDYQVQISTLGSLVSQLQALGTAASALSTGGVVPMQASSTYSDFTVTGSAQAAGSYDISVTMLAQEAKMRSASYTSAQDASLIPAGNLQFSIDGKNTAVIDTTGKSLADIADSINQDVPQLTASVVADGTGKYFLNVARNTTGYATTSAAALTVVSDPGLGLTVTQNAQNAELTVDKLPIQRTTNTISDIIPGVTLNLTGQSGADNNVVFAANSSGSAAALGNFVSAYNTLATTLTTQLDADPTQAYGNTLIDYSTAANIENSMQQLLSQVVVPSGAVSSLADLGLELQQDGTLNLDTTTLNNAIAANPGAVNAIFSTATTGIAASVQSLVDGQTNATTGALVNEESSLNSSISDMSTEETDMQNNLNLEQATLTAQFTAMQQLVSSFTRANSYLTAVQSLQNSNASG